MARLAELMHQYSELLENFSRRMKDAIFDEISQHDDYGPIYTVKYRVKSYQSMLSNINKLAKTESDPRKEKAENILVGNQVTIEDVFQVIDDLVGLRIVCLFHNTVDHIIEDIKGNVWSWFKILMKKDGTLKLKNFEFSPKSPTGYTSIHVSGQFSMEDSRGKKFVCYPCEIQVRTILEEAWGELDHFLVYKQRHMSESVKIAMKQHKQIMDSLDQAASKLFSDSRTRVEAFNAAERDFQVVGNYLYDSKADLSDRNIPEAFNDKHIAGYLHRKSGDHSSALAIFIELSTPQCMRDVPVRHRHEMRRRLLCDQAYELLRIGGQLERERAGVLYESVLQGNAEVEGKPNHFWATLRLGYVHHKRGDVAKAISFAQKAVKLCDYWFQAKGAIPWWKSDGLRSDTRAYLGTLLWHRAEDEFRKAWDYKGTKKLAKFKAAIVLGRKAIQATDGALKLLSEKDGKNREVIEIRCLNNLAYYQIQIGDFNGAQSAIEGLKRLEKRHSAFTLDTLAWWEFKRPGGNIIAAHKLITEAVDLLEVQRHSVMPLPGVITVELHGRIIISCKNTEDYREGEEYWNRS